MKTPFFLLPLLAASLFGAAPFTSEEFNTALNTSRWFIYDYATKTYLAKGPDWNAIDGGANPEASTTFSAGNGVSFVATESSSEGTFYGDYLSAGIDGIDCDIYAQNADLIQSVEFSFFHNEVFYYSDPFTLNNHDWTILQYSFTTDPWYYIDGDGFFVEEVITDEMLSNIGQIEVAFFPFGDSAIGSRVGLDNFTLIGQVPTTPMEIDTGNENDLTLSFSQEDGFSYTIETNDDLTGDGWSNLSPETTDLTGTEPFQTTIPLTMKQFLRLVTSPIYYGVPDLGR